LQLKFLTVLLSPTYRFSIKIVQIKWSVWKSLTVPRRSLNISWRIHLRNYNKKIRKTQKYSFSECLLRHDVVRVFVSFCIGFCTGHFVMVPLNLTYLHYLQHSLFKHLFNLYYKSVKRVGVMFHETQRINHIHCSCFKTKVLFFLLCHFQTFRFAF